MVACGIIAAGRDDALEQLQPSVMVVSRYPLRWMAARALLIVLVKAHCGQYKHDNRYNKGQHFVVRHNDHPLW